ncbi:MAG TPA: bifunctional sulfate adenylyltransferase/adenylylsulfate kinase [Desulfobacterales bacterium]|nr:bifunctional sulfate adenylyltransferase/adenylylsulfate kinase [Desulfobacterales bacterium]
MNPVGDGIEEAYGGKLVDLLVDPQRAQVLKGIALELHDIILNERQLCDLELLATGAFSPLSGFMKRMDYEAVLNRMRLENGLLWPIPVCLDVHQTQVHNLEAGQSVALRDPEGYLLAIMHVDDIWPLEAEAEAMAIYGTTDKCHPGVQYLLEGGRRLYIGGSIEVLSLPLHFDFKQLRFSPRDVRSLFQKLGWQRVIGFQTRNPIHRPQFEMTVRAMRQAKANLLLLPIVGMTKPGDFDHYTRVRCYKSIMRYYPPDSHVLSLLPLAKRMAGPREALLHMIIAKNYGCSHFIVGRDHASPGRDSSGKPFYGKDEAQEVSMAFAPEIGVEVIPFQEMVYLPYEEEFRTLEEIQDGTQYVSMSGSEIRERVKQGKKIPEWATFPEVLDELRRMYPPPRKQGFTVFLTGLSGAGKSTIAKVLYSRFLEIGDRPVTLLDGDIVRRNLSSELGFSKEHRDINVRRIGFVASEITKNRGIAICAPIAPYASTRAEVRATIEAYGGFVEVHVATPIEICEKRDRKGMYAKARAGLIKGFTGVDDPYEEPENPEVRIDTTEITPEEAAQEILLYLGQRGYI